MNTHITHPRATAIALAAILCSLTAACGGGNSPPEAAPPSPPASSSPPSSGSSDPPPNDPAARDPLGTGPEACTDGMAGDFPCRGIALESRLALDAMDGTGGTDIWGWWDEDTGNEYALMGLDNGTAFVDISDPKQPRFVGRLPTQTRESGWRDIKVYEDHAYIVADDADAHGMQVFDLKRLREASGPQEFVADVLYDGFENAHNLAINEETGFAYALATDTCNGGLHMIDITTPNNPMFANCHDNVRTHDTQCVLYRGPDADYRGREICFSSAEDQLEIVDVTNKTATLTVATTTYPDQAFVHQGWLTEDHRYFLLGDEMDESDFQLNTRTHVFDVSDLKAPTYLYAHDLGTSATDHNLYVKSNRVYEANYTTGLRVLEFMNLAERENIEEIAFFDTFPEDDSIKLYGAWSVYPFLPSGILIVSDIDNGLFVLSMQ